MSRGFFLIKCDIFLKLNLADVSIAKPSPPRSANRCIELAAGFPVVTFKVKSLLVSHTCYAFYGT